MRSICVPLWAVRWWAMSQYGANILAKQGLSAEEIVQHYFSNTTVGYYDG